MEHLCLPFFRRVATRGYCSARTRLAHMVMGGALDRDCGRAGALRPSCGACWSWVLWRLVGIVPESDPVIAVVSSLLIGAVLFGVLTSVILKRRPAHAA
jgi:hypothetical protein